MITGNELIVVFKLVSGEQIMAVWNGEDDHYIDVSYPMQIKTLPIIVQGQTKETITASPWCHFTDDRDYRISKRDVMFVKKLSPNFITHYSNMVEEYAPRERVKEQPKKMEWDFDDDPNEITLDEVNRRLDILKSLLGDSQEPEEEQEDEFKYFVEGNETIH